VTLTLSLHIHCLWLSFEPEQRGMNWDCRAQALSTDPDTRHQTPGTERKKRNLNNGCKHFCVAHCVGALQVVCLNPHTRLVRWFLGFLFCRCTNMSRRRLLQICKSSPDVFDIVQYCLSLLCEPGTVSPPLWARVPTLEH
jgi:hypothetical protein